MISEKVRYIYNNPVEQGLLHRPEDCIYSSATDYAGMPGLLEGVTIVDL